VLRSYVQGNMESCVIFVNFGNIEPVEQVRDFFIFYFMMSQL